jgi:hypothetical protein
MVVFGWRQTAKQLATMMMQCRHCGMQGRQHVFRTITWFTLFWVPVLPLHFGWKMVCGTCGGKTKITKAQADAFAAQAPART